MKQQLRQFLLNCLLVRLYKDLTCQLLSIIAKLPQVMISLSFEGFNVSNISMCDKGGLHHIWQV